MNAKGACLFPPGTESSVIAQFLKYYLSQLPEPLLTFRMVPLFVSSVHDFEQAKMLLNSLPPPNKVSIDLILDLGSRIASNSEVN